MSWEFHLPTRICFGRGMLEKLGQQTAALGRVALVVGYRDQTGLEEEYDRAMRRLRAADLEPIPLFDVQPEPDSQLPEAGAEAAREARAEVVVALGGGSVIDTAKAIALLARSGGVMADYLSGSALPSSAAALPIVAVPTTAGTGAEVSDVAVFSHAGATGSLKASMYGPALRPAVALVDPDLAEGTPPALTAACGADALGHAIEACLSRQSQPIASALARQAVALVVGNLERAVAEPQDAAPREPLALAATLAGMAFTASGLTAAHAVAQALGAVLGVPHGMAVAVATRVGLRHNAEGCAEQYAELAAACGLAPASRTEQAARFVERIDALLDAVGLPRQIHPPAGGWEEDLLNRLVQNAMASARIPILLNPRRVSRAELRTMFAEITL